MCPCRFWLHFLTLSSKSGSRSAGQTGLGLLKKKGDPTVSKFDP